MSVERGPSERVKEDEDGFYPAVGWPACPPHLLASHLRFHLTRQSSCSLWLALSDNRPALSRRANFAFRRPLIERRNARTDGRTDAGASRRPRRDTYRQPPCSKRRGPNQRQAKTSICRRTNMMRSEAPQSPTSQTRRPDTQSPRDLKAMKAKFVLSCVSGAEDKGSYAPDTRRTDGRHRPAKGCVRDTSHRSLPACMHARTHASDDAYVL